MIQMRLKSLGNFDVEIKEELDYTEYHREYLRKWEKEHPLKKKEFQKKYRQTQKGKERKTKHESKRRKLGFVPLNKSFENSVGHHIDKLHVIYIPHKLHVSIPHNVWTGCNMAEINNKVYEWLGYIPL